MRRFIGKIIWYFIADRVGQVSEQTCPSYTEGLLDENDLYDALRDYVEQDDLNSIENRISQLEIDL